jgi:hypothetical protein
VLKDKCIGLAITENEGLSSGDFIYTSRGPAWGFSK